MEKIINVTLNDQSIKLPDMRNELIATLKDLSDIKRQKKEWVDPQYDHAFWDTMRFSIETFEGIPLESAPLEQIGYTIRNEEELTQVIDVMNKLWKVMDVIGIEKSDADYLNSPLWQDVVNAATETYNYIKEKGFDKDYIEWLEEVDPPLS